MTGFETMTAAEHREKTILAWTEKQFQEQVVGLAKTLGWWVYHPYSSQRSTPGFPDLYLAHPKHGIIQRELKTEKGRLSSHQREAIALITKAGGDVAVWRPRDYLNGRIQQELSPASTSANLSA